jgi:hypothetical protein
MSVGATGIGASMVEAFTLQGIEVIILDILDDAAYQMIDHFSNGQQQQRRDVLTPECEAELLWLVADHSSGVTNQSIAVDAGWT